MDIQKPKIKKKIDVRATIMTLPMGGTIPFKITKDLSANKVRACVSRINAKKQYDFSTSENGLEITVTRNK